MGAFMWFWGTEEKSVLNKNPAVPNLFFFPVTSSKQELKEDQRQTTDV